jgi:DNA polymerase-3 subunit delta
VIHLLYGKDSYQVSSALSSIRNALGVADDMIASNTTVLEGRNLVPDELLAHATAVPFLAANRLVIVDGLLRALGEVKRGRAKKKSDVDDPLAGWRQAATVLADPATMPETTTLVFVEAELAKSNAAFTIFAPLAKTVEFNPLSGNELAAWVKNTAKREKIKLTEGAAKSLVDLIGGDLWALSNELKKLDTYAAGEAVGEAAVAELVPAAHETKFWDVADAVIAGDERRALTSLRRLLVDGYPPQVIMSMIVKQYRQLLLVKDLRDRRVGRDETARASGVPGFKLDAVSATAQRYSWPRLREAYGKLIESDLSVKRGLQDDESALQLLIHELCAMRPASGARPLASPRA